MGVVDDEFVMSHVACDIRTDDLQKFRIFCHTGQGLDLS